MPPPRSPSSSEASPRYVLDRPDIAAARAAVLRILPAMFSTLWPQLLQQAAISGQEGGEAAFQRLLEAMSIHPEPVVRLCATSLRIRLSTFDQVVAPHRRPSGAPR